MKVKWKITIGIVALFAILISVSFFAAYWNFKMASKQGARVPSLPPPEPLGAVDRLLEEMEFGTIAFNAPTNININDSPQIQLILRSQPKIISYFSR